MCKLLKYLLFHDLHVIVKCLGNLTESTVFLNLIRLYMKNYGIIFLFRKYALRQLQRVFTLHIELHDC